MPLPDRLRLAALWLAVVTGTMASTAGLAQPVEPQAEDRAADPIPPAAPAPPGYFLLSVPGGQEVFERLGLRAEERGFGLLLLARALHGAAIANPSGSLAISFTEIFGPVTAPSAPVPVGEGPPVMLLAPFSDRTWRRALALEAGVDLFTAIVKNRGALLVAGAALEAGPGVREWMAEDPKLFVQVLQLWPGSFAQAARALSRTSSGWVVPGDTAPWTALVGAPPSRSDEFFRRLLSRDEGQLARFFATIANLSDERRAALLEPAPGESATDTLVSLYHAARDAEAPWPPNLYPYQLSYADLPSVLHALSDLPTGPLPATAGLWPALVGGTIDSREGAADLLEHDPAPVPYAATVRALLRGTPRERRERIAMLSFARRIWDASAPPSAQVDALYALGHFRRFRALLLALDRIDVRRPDVWARLVDAARRVDSGGGRDRALRLTVMQSALAIVVRAALVRSIQGEALDEVLLALAAAVNSELAAPDAVRGWLLDSLLPALPPLTRPDRFSGVTAYESRVLQALGGPSVEDPPRLRWEGLDYAVDHSAAEHQRILQIRAQLPSPGLDAALEQKDAALLAAALRTLVYAPALGDPEGAVTLSPDVVDRHDFGGSRATPGREFAWAPAQERSGSGLPWHVAGSLIGLDLALARSSLRRISADEMPPVPTINLNDELTLTRTAVALQPLHFDDATRAAVLASIERGRARVRAAGTDLAAIRRLADEAAVPRVVQNSLAWSLASSPEVTSRLFSRRDLLWLGGPTVDRSTLSRWGVMGDSVDGRLVPRLEPPIAWDRLAGRPDTGVLATQVPDLTLRLAEVTAALGVPASLVPSLLLYATQDYWHEVEARFADDWPALVRGASALPTSRVEDYIASLGSGGALRPR